MIDVSADASCVRRNEVQAAFGLGRLVYKIFLSFIFFTTSLSSYCLYLLLLTELNVRFCGSVYVMSGPTQKPH